VLVTAGTTRAVALDGPSGSGKSTVARGVARQLGWRYVDTGATYRAVTLAVLRAGVDPADPAAVDQVARDSDVRVSTDPEQPGAYLDGVDVSAEIRGPEVTAAVSAVSAVPEVRRRLVELQRALAGADGAVVEGRDIAAVVLPDAAVKVYLDASPEERARRRAGDQQAGVATAGSADPGATPADAEPAGDLHAAVAADLARRDALDSGRSVSPLAVADGATVLDSSGMGADAVIAAVLDLVRQAGVLPPGRP
jgi:cytidylate kinase